MLILNTVVPAGAYPTALNPKLWTTVWHPNSQGGRTVFQFENEAETQPFSNVGKTFPPHGLRPEHLGLESFEDAPGYRPLPPRDPNAPVHHYGPVSVSRPFRVGSPVTRGTLKVASATPILNGTHLKIHTQHGAFDDPMKFDLHLLVNGAPFLIKNLAENVPSGETYQPEFGLDVDYTDVNEHLAALNPNLGKVLKVGPGTPLAVNGVWGTGHLWGLPNSGRDGGTFIAA